MPLLLPPLISNASRPHHPFVLLESSVSQSCLQIFKSIVNHGIAKSSVLLCCFLYPPSSIVSDVARSQDPRFEALDRTASVPGYCDAWEEPGELIKQKIESGT